MTTTVTAADNAPKVLISQTGRKGDPGTDGTNGNGFNQVRKSLLDNPLCHLFKTNKLVDTSAPTNTDSDITFTRASTATYVDRYGIVKTAAVDTIREEKDGFLIEQAGTNLIQYSEAFDNAAWVKTASGAGQSVVVTSNYATAPDGSLTADRLIFETGGATSSDISTINQSVASVDGTGSFWLKSNSGTVTLQLIVDFDSAIYLTITDQWQRFSTGTSGVTNDIGLRARGHSTSNSVDILAWGAQIEQSLAATSYIPTVGSAVTRIADKTLLPVLNNVVTKEFSIFGIISNISTATTGNKFIFRMPVNGGFFAFFYSAGSPNQFIFRYDDGSVAVQTGVIVTENIKYFTATVDGSNIKLNINGTESLDAKLSDPSLLLANNFPIFASSVSVGAQFNGNIKDFRIYDFALNANEIEYLLP